MPDGGFPHVWGSGALFAAGGLSGQTHHAASFFGVLGPRVGEIVLETLQRRTLRLKADYGDAGDFEVTCCLPDLVQLESPAGQPFFAVFSAWHTVVGSVPPGYRLELDSEFAIPAGGADCFLSRDSRGRDVVALAQGEGRFALSFGEEVEVARGRALAAMEIDPSIVLERRREAYRQLVPDGGPRAALARRAFGVIAAHAGSPEGGIAQPWVASSRTPLGPFRPSDVVFVARALAPSKPEFALGLVKAALGLARPDGTIPPEFRPEGVASPGCTGPGLAWTLAEIVDASPEPLRVEPMLPLVEKHVLAQLAQRDRNANGLLEWNGADGGAAESGLANSPRFRDTAGIDAVDASTFACLDLFALVRLNAAAGRLEKAEHWQRRAVWLASTLHASLWDEAAGCFLDHEATGGARRARTSAGFGPLLLPVMEPVRLRRLADLARDPLAFGTEVPIPTVAADAPGVDYDAWNGAVWPIHAWVAAAGFARHGRKQLARSIAGRVLDEIARHHAETGCLWEFYDPHGVTVPAELPRLGPPRSPADYRKKVDNVRDALLTATAVVLLARV